MHSLSVYFLANHQPKTNVGFIKKKYAETKKKTSL